MTRPTRAARRERPDPTDESAATTLGYDSEQKSAYETERLAPDARRTANSVHEGAAAAHEARQAAERDTGAQ